MLGILRTGGAHFTHVSDLAGDTRPEYTTVDMTGGEFRTTVGCVELSEDSLEECRRNDNSILFKQWSIV